MRNKKIVTINRVIGRTTGALAWIHRVLPVETRKLRAALGLE